MDSYAFEKSKLIKDTIRFESAFSLWSGLDDITRAQYYSQAVGGISSAQSDFNSFKSKAGSRINEQAKNISSLESAKRAIEEDAASKSYVTVEKEKRVAIVTKNTGIGIADSNTETGYSTAKEKELLSQKAGQLNSLDAGIQDSQKAIRVQEAKVAASAVHAANNAEQAANEAAYLSALETAFQEGFRPSLRFRKLETFESTEPRIDKTISATFDSTGRVLVKSAGQFKVKVTKTATNQVSGIGDAQPAYKRYCVVDGQPGDTYSIHIQSNDPITVIVEEVR